MSCADDRPLVVTATLDPRTQSFLDALRAAHFPAGRNHLAAHLTLFHAVPAGHAGDALDDLRAAAAEHAPMPARVTGPRPLGRGVAFVVDCAPLHTVRRDLARRWAPRLTRQDAGKTDLHVTVQNKVDPATARALHDELAATVPPWDATVTGLAVWRYAGGPWEPAAELPFGRRTRGGGCGERPGRSLHWDRSTPP